VSSRASPNSGPAGRSRLDGILAFLDHVEKTLPVSSWTVGGFHVWPILRIHFGASLIIKLEFDRDNQISRYAQQSSRAMQILGLLTRSLEVRWKDRKRNATPNSAVDVVFLVASTGRYFKVGSEWYHPYTDSFIKYLRDFGLTSLVFETTPDTDYRIPRFDDSVLIQHRLFLLSAAAKIAGAFSRAGDERLEGFDRPRARAAACVL